MRAWGRSIHAQVNGIQVLVLREVYTFSLSIIVVGSWNAVFTRNNKTEILAVDRHVLFT